jgi:HAD superfamily hydrolase (TIGR01509 family)
VLTGTVSRVEAVVFDLDGVLVDSERMWDEVRRAFAAAHGGRWLADSTRAMQGMSTPEWAEYLVTAVGVELSPEDAAAGVIEEMARRYAEGPPVIDGAVQAVRAVAARYPVAIASSSPPVLIKAFLDSTDLAPLVPVALSSEQTGAGKPAPDVYLAAARKLGVEASVCAAVEDSTNGLRAALAAGMTVYAIPNLHFPPDPEVLAEVTVVNSIAELPDALG